MSTVAIEYVGKRTLSYHINDLIDSLAGEAVERVCKTLEMADHLIQEVRHTVTAAFRAAYDGVLARTQGKSFQYAAARSFIVQELQHIGQHFVDHLHVHFNVDKGQHGSIKNLVYNELVALVNHVVPHPDDHR